MDAPEVMKLRPSVERLVFFSVLVAYLALTAVGVHFHEPWRDEAQKWLIARDSESLGALFRELPYEGTPGLWPLMLRPLARAGLPYATMGWLNWLLMAVAAVIFWTRAPLPMLVKGLFLFSYTMAFEYPVVARNYSLTILLLFALLALYARRWEHPLAFSLTIFLLVNSSVMGILVAWPLILLFLVEALQVRSSVGTRVAVAGITIGGFILLLLQILPRGAGGSVRQVYSAAWNPKGMLMVLNNVFFMGHEKSVPMIAGLIVLLVILAGLARHQRGFLVALGSVTAVIMFSARFSSNWRHHGFILLALMAGLWVAHQEEPHPPPPVSLHVPRGWRDCLPSAHVSTLLISLILIPSVWLTGGYYRKEINLDYSGAQRMARFIRDEGLTGVPIAALPTSPGIALIPYLGPTRIYNPTLFTWQTHLRQDPAHFEGETQHRYMALAHILTKFGGEKRFLLLLNQPWPTLAGIFPCRLINQTSSFVGDIDENFFLYECHPDSVRK